MVRILGMVALVASFVVAPMVGRAAQPTSENDTARFLAGIQPSADSPLRPLLKDWAWQQHASRFNGIFAKVESKQVGRIHTWARAKLISPSPVLFYMFSGPDFLYAHAFFPNASTYVMSGLEPVGSIPDLTKLSRDDLDRSLRNVEASLNSILTYSFFQTIDMRHTLVASRVTGTLPILYVFLARSGNTIRDVSRVTIDKDGTVQADDAIAGTAQGADGVRGVKIEFAGDDGRPRTLYYFSANVDNGSFKPSGFEAFCERLGAGDALIKSASYLLHRDRFSDVRNFLLEHSRLLVQDDSGIPVTQFDQATWQLRPFGHYSGPIGLFANRYQSQLARLFDQGHTEAIDFGIGYQWRPQSSNLMVATKTNATISGDPAGNQPVSPRRGESNKDRSVLGSDATDRNRSHHSGKHVRRNRSISSGIRYSSPWPFW
jgi:hypothetical protein